MRYSIGVDRLFMDSVYEYQESSKWCWAACMEMALSVYGLYVDQTDFTHDLCGLTKYGGIADCPASVNQMHFYLNGYGTDNYGTRYKVDSKIKYGSPNAGTLIQELESSRPIIVAYTNQRMNMGHAVLITGAEIYQNPITGRKTITKLILRDPANNFDNRRKKGRRVVNAGVFVQEVYASWVPKVQNLGYYGLAM